MISSPEFGNVTGTRDKDYDIIWFTEACLSNVLRLETYIEDAALTEMTNSLTSSGARSTRVVKVPKTVRDCWPSG